MESSDASPQKAMNRRDPASPRPHSWQAAPHSSKEAISARLQDPGSLGMSRTESKERMFLPRRGTLRDVPVRNANNGVRFEKSSRQGFRESCGRPEAIQTPELSPVLPDGFGDTVDLNKTKPSNFSSRRTSKAYWPPSPPRSPKSRPTVGSGMRFADVRSQRGSRSGSPSIERPAMSTSLPRVDSFLMSLHERLRRAKDNQTSQKMKVLPHRRSSSLAACHDDDEFFDRAASKEKHALELPKPLSTRPSLTWPIDAQRHKHLETASPHDRSIQRSQKASSVSNVAARRYVGEHHVSRLSVGSNSMSAKETSQDRRQAGSSRSHRYSKSDGSKSFVGPPIEQLPACPRPEPTSEHDGWYTIEGLNGIKICPPCTGATVGRSKFTIYVKHCERQGRGTKVQCAFSSPWMRIAWLLTLRDQRDGLELMHAMFSISKNEPPCPGMVDVTGIWYSLMDGRGAQVRNFFVCPTDLRRIEALLPSLRGAFARVQPSHSPFKVACSLRVHSSCFAAYVDELIAAEESASRSRGRRRTLDLGPLIELTRERVETPICQRDTLLVDRAWHVIPSLPDFTVCQSCFAAVVQPAVRAGDSVVAQLVTPAPQLVPFGSGPGSPHGGGGLGQGRSCQLYSPRMRRVWATAVAADDLQYLARRVRDRRAAEMTLWSKQEGLRRLVDADADADADWSLLPSAGGHGGSKLDPEFVRDELERIAAEWERWE